MEEMYADLAEKLRLQKIEASKNEISVENLVKPSELLKRERSVRRSQKTKKTEKIQVQPEINPADSEQIEQHEALNDRLGEEPAQEPVDQNMNSIEQGKFYF